MNRTQTNLFECETQSSLEVVHTYPVLLPLALDDPYDYALVDDALLSPGDFVLVPLGSTKRVGVVWHEASQRPPVAKSKLKLIVERLDIPPLPLINLIFANWVANYTLAHKGMVLQMMMSARLIFETEEPRWGFRLGGAEPQRMTAARQRIIDTVSDGTVWSKKKLMDQAKVSAAVIDGLAESGTLLRAQLPRMKVPQPDPGFAMAQLTPQQSDAVDRLKQTISKGDFSVSLLDGVTGSGKTEVYFEAVSEALARGTQVLILLPEIALTTQFLDRFQRRFGCRPAEWHSAVTPKERARVWKGVAEGDIRIVAGARSALFLPFCDLGLIIVDEEHDPSFKQDDRVIYQARDMAVARASLGHLPIMLCSATPSVESVVNVQRKRYESIVLPNRFSGNALPLVKAVDLKSTSLEKGMWISEPVVEAVNYAFSKNEQALLFLNRRGYAPLTLCRSCGHRFVCPQCTAYLVEHRLRGRLICHHCGFTLPFPKSCPSCTKEGHLTASGPGVERIMEEVSNRWPQARMAVLSSDLIPTLTALRDLISQIANGDYDIIVGTQLVSKGHNFPKLSFVGIIDGDLSLATADPRAGERTFQLLHQVTGRAGRFGTEGHGLIQTHYPDHPVMQALISGDREAFYEAEIGIREQAGYPPFGRLAAIVITAETRVEAEEYARKISLAAPQAQKIDVLGPVEAPLAMIRGRHRQRLLIKAARDIDLQAYLRDWFSKIDPPRGSTKVQVDIDPYNFL